MRLHIYLGSIGIVLVALAAPGFARSAFPHHNRQAPQTSTPSNPLPPQTPPPSNPLPNPLPPQAPPPASAPVITVGPGGQYQTISAAVAAADANASISSVIDVMPGTYTNDFPLVTRPMTIEVNPAFAGQPVILQATEPLPNEKGIILTTASLTVNGLTFTGAQIDDSLGGNGAGIRVEMTGSGSLTVLNSAFIGNQEGILTDPNPNATFTIVNSQFKNNGNPDGSGQEHGIYIGIAASLSVSNSLFCGELYGHNIKSRAAVTLVAQNTLYAGQADPAIGCNAGSTSFEIDLPNGGVATISGNQILQGDAAQNHNMIAYGEEGFLYTGNSLMVTGNSFTSTGDFPATTILDPVCTVAQLSGNAFQNVGTIINPANCVVFQ